ncbi:nitroreductase family deazaflavin-dependent oxidoreductase [Gordonia rhizosphera]|uniref:Nitroreductase n=1 Tax=Gordonia rhizosphera NBRC 16068 TaxID=1108045 RepID=K6UYX8_9ACTN|nr:nitroreductase family deazaflavin-dependent oxidoreductase [Gordonia rhizosphera]GAB88673.1 hypothetical protein GORHZ_035_00130 [Gordonia rhizosphera NBRC 16068]
MSDFNGTIIDEFRSNGGFVKTAGFGDNLILLHTVGIKSREPRINPLFALPDDGSWLVVGSAAGSPKTPAWVHNLRAMPEVDLEVPVDGTVVGRRATVRELSPEERDAAWQRFLGVSDGFRKYTETAEGRRFPIFRLTPVDR